MTKRLGYDDVDERLRAELANQGIESLYPPQEDALDAVLRRRNLVLSIPTASGKSLVAYVALVSHFFNGPAKAKGLYIVPLRALATEKYDELRAFSSLGLKVAIATGDLDDEDQRLGQYDVVVATSEKADSLLRHRAAWMNDVQTVVADEVHLLHDPGRGPTLEVLLARLRARNPTAQILALSATIQNANELAEWLGADLVQSTWRPTKLKRGVAYGNRIDFGDDGDHEFQSFSGDAVTDLVLDAHDQGGQALVFVNTRRSAEAVAERLSKALSGRLSTDQKAALDALTKELVDPDEPSMNAKRLAKCVRGGSAFHTAGLTSRQRRLIETAFRARVLRVLSATPTLAAGVNTPARRVVVRDLGRFEVNAGHQPLPVLEVQQMMGRAGRPRFDPYGEAVLLAKTHDDVEMIRESYLSADPEPITSKLGTEPALRVHVLAGVAAGYTTTYESVKQFLDATFYAHQGEAWLIHSQLDYVLDFLEENGFVRRDGESVRATPFGKRTSDLYVDPLSALVIRRAVERAKERKELSAFALLHAISATPDLGSLYLRAKDDWVAQTWAEHGDQLLLYPEDARSQEEFLSFIKTASLLHDWIQEQPLDQIEQKYGVGPGDVRNKVDRAQWLAHATRELARLLDYESSARIRDLPLRLRHGVREEVLPLLELPGVGRVRARALFRHGFTSLGALRKARRDELAAIKGIGPVMADRIIKHVGGTPPHEATLGRYSA